MNETCRELAACCPSVSGALGMACGYAVQANIALGCYNALVDLRAMGYCPVTGTGGTGSGGTSTGGTSTGGTNTGGTSTGGASGSTSGGTGGATPECTNVALHATATAQTSFSGYSPARAVDGNRSTGLGGATSWANDWRPPEVMFPQWFDIEFGAERTLRRVELYTTADYPIKQYDLSYWDGQSYQLISTVTDNVAAHVTHEFDEIATSSLRILAILGPDHQFNHARLNEVEAYEATAASCP